MRTRRWIAGRRIGRAALLWSRPRRPDTGLLLRSLARPARHIRPGSESDGGRRNRARETLGRPCFLTGKRNSSHNSRVPVKEKRQRIPTFQRRPGRAAAYPRGTRRYRARNGTLRIRGGAVKPKTHRRQNIVNDSFLCTYLPSVTQAAKKSPQKNPSAAGASCRRVNPFQNQWCRRGDSNPHEVSLTAT